jgi:Na+/proline symporter
MNPNSPGHTTKQRLYFAATPETSGESCALLAPSVLVIGILFMVTAFVNFVGAMSSHSGPPKLFWCFFVGMPLMFVGAALCMFGFMGAVARYTAAEQAPVAADAVNYLAENTQEGVKTVSKAVAQGAVEGIQEATALKGAKAQREK